MFRANSCRKVDACRRTATQSWKRRCAEAWLRKRADMDFRICGVARQGLMRPIFLDSSRSDCSDWHATKSQSQEAAPPATSASSDSRTVSSFVAPKLGSAPGRAKVGRYV